MRQNQYKHLRSSELQLSHTNKHLMDLCQALFVAVNKVLGEVLEFFRNEFQCLRIVGRELDLLPQILGCVSSFNSFDEQVTVTILLTDGCITTVGQWTSTSDTKTCHIIGILTKRPLSRYLALKRAKLMIDNLPNDVVVLHDQEIVLLVLRLLNPKTDGALQGWDQGNTFWSCAR